MIPPCTSSCLPDLPFNTLTLCNPSILHSIASCRGVSPISPTGIMKGDASLCTGTDSALCNTVDNLCKSLVTNRLLI